MQCAPKGTGGGGVGVGAYTVDERQGQRAFALNSRTARVGTKGATHLRRTRNFPLSVLISVLKSVKRDLSLMVSWSTMEAPERLSLDSSSLDGVAIIWHAGARHNITPCQRAFLGVGSWAVQPKCARAIRDNSEAPQRRRRPTGRFAATKRAR